MNENRPQPMKQYLFFRKDEQGKTFFYFVEDVDDEHILNHISLNPGTLRVESATGRLVWKEGDQL